MIVIPAIDLAHGACVRLVEGRRDTARIVARDAITQALSFEAAGAERIHIVDLDGAFEGQPKNAKLIREIAGAVSIPIQVGGGLRDRATVEACLDAGAQFVILGTMLIDNPQDFEAIAKDYFGRIIAGIDTRDGQAATEGWVHQTEKTALDLAKDAENRGACAVITTDIRRDGTGHGVNVAHTAALAAAVKIPVIASGGVSTLADIGALAKASVAGAIVGRALYDGVLDLAEAIAEAKRSA